MQIMVVSLERLPYGSDTGNGENGMDSEGIQEVESVRLIG